jgi:hypothetical protein
VRIDASGELRLLWHERAWRFEVRHLVAHLDWRFTAIPAGLRPSCRLVIDSVDADLPALPGVKDGRSLWKKAEEAADRSFDKHLAKRVLPRGAPIDAVVDGRIASANVPD